MTETRIAIAARWFVWGGGAEFLRMLANALLLKARTKPLRVYLLVPGESGTVLPEYSMFPDYFKNLDGELTIELHDDSHDGLAACLRDIKADVVLPFMRSPGRDFPVPWVGYVYDFQHRYLTEFFTADERASRDADFANLMRGACAVITNSAAVKRDIHEFYPRSRAEVFDMPFAAAPVRAWFEGDPREVLDRYGLPEKYFLISNQFWVHKSHITAFRALARLREQTSDDVHIVCTGKTEDSRFPDHFAELQNEINALGIEDRVRFLGHIPKIDQVRIMRGAIALLQPSLFEGGPGGGSVYDAVSLGVPAVVSDIPVNTEVVGEKVSFFKAGDPSDMASKLARAMTVNDPRPEAERLVEEGERRTEALGDRLLEAIGCAIKAGSRKEGKRSSLVHVLIPVHNRAGITMRCLNNLYRQDFDDFRVVVVDDGSTDGTSDYIREKFPQTEILKGDGNLWWTGAMRKGVEHILKTAADGDYIMSLNDDVTFEEDLLSSLVGASVSNGRAITGSFCRYVGTNIFDADGVYLKWRLLRNGSCRPRYHGVKELPQMLDGLTYLYGHGTLFPVEVFRKVGNFNAAELPHYGGDTEFSYRAGQAGFRQIAISKALVNVFEKDTEHTGVHGFDSWYIPFSRAWAMLFSMRSSLQLKMVYKLLDLMCPPMYRPTNKIRETWVCVRASFSRTLPFMILSRALKYLTRPFPVPAFEFTSRGVDLKSLVKEDVVRFINFRGREYYWFTGDNLPQEDESVQELYLSSTRLWNKITWFGYAFRKRMG